MNGYEVMVISLKLVILPLNSSFYSLLWDVNNYFVSVIIIIRKWTQVNIVF